jgi:hypothetical protein
MPCAVQCLVPCAVPCAVLPGHGAQHIRLEAIVACGLPRCLGRSSRGKPQPELPTRSELISIVICESLKVVLPTKIQRSAGQKRTHRQQLTALRFPNRGTFG